ncbi:toluene transporter [Acetobacter pasteurianus]|uniref:Toluene transporter auxiliary component Ttg1D n=5 Tax=Acetobacter pasteurianus TaxID=438 RepID=A0A401WQL2_ACEPA|nr:ABC transporter substrate-binding protein [Acetobacter pasteurianus]BAU37443.1 toluene transporter auxiliary component Ttg1D [Acetobacter pasteurianus NBRC 101655]ASC05126.1 hypothetical protein S101468_00859 [Acetobacter pasteurianus subsp. pasteurianus]OAZ73863.1 hypothetical protein SRCM100623_00692 [Acetobacter pasteurianus]QHM91156.1 ABC transporter substrate-binding protein [Acetobacter pasteurianus]RCL07110.1 toluene transporter [Acetobacter pasteurianus]
MKRFSIRAGLVFGMTMALLPVAGAGISAPAAFAQSAPASAVSAPIQTLYKALDQVQNAHSSFADRSQMVAGAVDQAYDLEAVLKASVGLRYDSLSPSDKQNLLAAFRNFTIARYVSSFKPGSGARFTVSPSVTDAPAGGGKIVETHIGSDDSMPGTAVSYIMHNEGGAWKITDVLLSDSRISQAAAQRSDFSSTLNSGGVQGLINVLNRKVQSYSKD